jgi:predicted RNA binding protein YcfA (HicA-like mRNA interferase family)
MPRLTPVHYQSLIRVFRKAGFSVDRQESSHIMMIKNGIPRPLVIPTYTEVQISIIKGLLRSAGMSREEYFRLLGS